MNILKKDFDCYACHTAGFIINSVGIYTTCPICRDSRLVRNVKQYSFNLAVKLFQKVSDLLDRINWASEDTLRFKRLYKVELSGHLVEAEEPPFQSYDEALNNTNEVIRNKYSHKILSSYLSGYSESLPYVELSLKTLLENQNYFEELYTLAKETHTNSTLGKDTIDAFYTRLQEVREDEAKAK